MSTLATELDDLDSAMTGNQSGGDDIDIDEMDAPDDAEFKDSDEDWSAAEPVKKKAKTRSRRRKKKAPLSAEDFYTKCHASYDGSAPRYNISQPYVVGDSLEHPKFGLGFVRSILSKTKVEVAFQDEVRRLVCNLPD